MLRKLLSGTEQCEKQKNFITIEQYTDIDKIQIPVHSAVLLECMGNLCANEMFRDDEIFYPVEKIIRNLKCFAFYDRYACYRHE